MRRVNQKALAIALFFVVAILGLAFKSTNEKSLVQDPFQKSLAAHGGLDKWNSYGTLKFDRGTGENAATHIIDLKNRCEKIISKSNTVGFGPEGFWIQTDDAKQRESLQRQRFYRNLWFYFFGLPFVTADPGVNQEVIADGTLDGKTYNRVKITFGDNVGDAPDDQYILWLEPNTGQLAIINYSVTYGKGAASSEDYNAIVFNEWQEVDGLIVPKKFTGHIWEDGKLGKERYGFEFSNVSFTTEQPDPSEFATPEGAAYLAY